MTRSGLIPRISRESRLLLGSSQASLKYGYTCKGASQTLQNGSETQWFQAAKSCQNRLSLFNMIYFHDFFMKKSKLHAAGLMPEKLVKWQCHKLKNCFLTEWLFPFPVQCVMTAADTCMRAHLALDTVPTFGRYCVLHLILIKMQIERWGFFPFIPIYKLLNIVWKCIDFIFAWYCEHLGYHFIQISSPALRKFNNSSLILCLLSYLPHSEKFCFR